MQAEKYVDQQRKLNDRDKRGISMMTLTTVQASRKATGRPAQGIIERGNAGALGEPDEAIWGELLIER